MSRIPEFLAELKRRRVYQVAVVYAAAAFVAAQAADLFLPRLGLPDWTVTLVVVFAVAGFPVALILGWAFDITPTGVRRTDAAVDGDSVPAGGPGASGAAGRVPPSGRGQWRVAGGTVAAAVVLVVGGSWLAARVLAPSTAIDRLAVLPLANLMEDPEQEYFVQGMHDALISELVQAGVWVINRTSMMPYRDAVKPVREIARELNVDAVVAGSVFRAGDSVRIQIQLVDGRTEGHLLVRTYDAELRDVLALHRRVTSDVAREIRTTIGPRVEARLERGVRVDPQAHEAYLRGRFHWFRLSPAELTTALRYFETALEHDPGYALAYTGIALVWAARGHLGFAPPGVAFPRWKEAALRALELDPTLPEAHALLAATRFYVDWDWAGADSTLARAVAANPGNAELRVWYAELLGATGRVEEALAEMRRALELDPHNSTFHGWLGQTLTWTGSYDEAIGHIRELLARDPTAPVARAVLWHALERTGRHAEAVAEFRNILVARRDLETADTLDAGYARGGYAAAMRAAADLAAARSLAGYVRPTRVADLYAAAGEAELALDWLDQGYEERDSQMVYLAVSPRWDGLRGEPRFRDMLRRMGLPQ